MADASAAAAAAPAGIPPAQTPLAALWASFSENKGAVGGLVVLSFIALCAIFADVLAPQRPQHHGRG